MKMQLRILFAAVALFVNMGAKPAFSQMELFSETLGSGDDVQRGEAAVREVTKRAGIIRARVTKVNPFALREGRLRLNLFPDAHLDTWVEKMALPPGSETDHYSAPPNKKGQNVRLSVTGGRLRGTVHSGDRVYRILPRNDGTTMILELAPHQHALCGVDRKNRK